jgi:hypothetical protein
MVAIGQLRSITSVGGRHSGLQNALNGELSRRGRNGGRSAVESGQLASIRTFENCSKGGRQSGLAAVASGQLQSITSKGGRAANHSRWHVKRWIVNPECEFCNE